MIKSKIEFVLLLHSYSYSYSCLIFTLQMITETFSTINNQTNINYQYYLKNATCKKIYPDLINKTQRNVTIHGYNEYPRSLCSCKNLRIQPITRVDSDSLSYDMIE